MPKLPTAIDYGARPSLETSRLDRPGTGSQALAAEAMAAATEFSNILEAKKEKQDSLNYALARNEILSADIAVQAELADDQDWKTHDDRYTAGIQTRVDEIYSRYDLDPSDRAMLDSESKLIRQKGRISVGGISKKLEISQGIAALDDGMLNAREAFILAPDIQRPEIMRGQLQAIDSAVKKGYISAEEGEQRRQIMTTDFARADLKALSREDRIEEVERSLGYRRGYGAGPESEFSDDIRAASDESGLPGAFIAAVAMQESSMDPDAISPAGNVGLMQLGELAAEDYSVTDRRNARQSLVGGARYLADLEDRYEGDRVKALAAYNWGPGKLSAAVDEYGDDWLAHAPAETQDYIKRLLPKWNGTDKESMALMTGQATGVGPMTREEILAGKGTESSADFLHTDELAAMLEADYGNDKENRNRTAAQELTDTAQQLYPGEDVESHKKRVAYIKANSEGTVRELAEGKEATHRNNQVANKQAVIKELADKAEEQINASTMAEPFTYRDIPEDEWNEMDAVTQKYLISASNMKERGQQYAEVTQVADPNDGRMSLEEWNELPNYGLGSKSDQPLDSYLWRSVLDEEAWWALKKEQDGLKALADSYMAPPDVRPYVDDLLSSMEIMQTAGRSDEEKAKATRLAMRLKNAVIAEMNSGPAPRELSTQEIDKLLIDVITSKGTILQDRFWIDSLNPDDVKPAFNMTKEEMNVAYITLTPEMPGPPPSKETGGRQLTMEQYLKQKAKDVGNPSVSHDDLERALFALENFLGTAEVNRRLMGL
jgi:hypothetical protein